jgi:4a-hydroxytetrahydrobiopterin dehydratase
MSKPPSLTLLSTVNEEAHAEVLTALTGWNLVDDGAALERRFDFPDFPRAFGFICSAALAAEHAGLHPEWSNFGGRVTIRLNGREGAVGEREVTLAHAINDLL